MQTDKYILPLLLGTCLFLQSVDSTSIIAAIPYIAADFSVRILTLNIAILSYLLTAVMLVPASGWLADTFGTKKIYLYALLIFGAGSLCSGISQSLTQLVISRLIQGVGASLMMPVSRQILFQHYQKHQLPGIMSKLPLMNLFGNLLGPILGGFLTTSLSWHWIFFINIPVIFIALLLSPWYIPNYSKPNKQPLDLKGLILFGAAFSLIIFFIQSYNTQPLGHYTSAVIPLCFILIFSYVIHSRRVEHPLLDMKLFASKCFKTAIINNLLMRFFIGGVSFLMMLFLQLNLKLNALQAGVTMLPLYFGMISMSFIYKRIIKFMPMKSTLIVNTIMISVVVASFSLITPSSSHAIIGLQLWALGMLVNSLFATANLIVYSDINKEDMSRAVTISSIVQQSGLSIGIGLAAVILEFYLRSPLSQSNIYSITAFHKTFITLGIALALITLNLTRLPTNAADEMRTGVKQS